MRFLRTFIKAGVVLGGVVSLVAAALAPTQRAPSTMLLFLSLATLAAGALPFSLPLPSRPLLRLSRILVYSSLLYYGWAPFTLLTALEALLCQSCGALAGPPVFGRKPATSSVAWTLGRPLTAALAGLAFEYCLSLGWTLPTGTPIFAGTLCAVLTATSLTVLLGTLNPTMTCLRLLDGAIQVSLELGAALAALVFHGALGESALPVFGIVLTLVAAIFRLREGHRFRERDLLRQVEENQDLYHATLQTMALAVDARDQIDQGHLFRVQAIALELARRAGIKNDNDLRGLAIAALLHDIGKLATPEYILSKNGSLTQTEMDTVEAHAEVGADILSLVPFPYPVLPFVRHHHERWDGKGYPGKLKGEEIPLGARILSIADCYDSMRTERPYRPGLSRRDTLEHIRSESGKSFDPQLATLLLENIAELDATAESACRDSLACLSPCGADHPPFNSGRRANVFQSIVSAHQEMQAIQEASRAAGHLMSIPEALAFLGGKIQSLVRDASCAIFIGAPGEPLECRFATGLCREELEGLQLEPGRGVTGWVAENGRSAINVSPALDFQGMNGAVTLFQSCLSVPLISEPGMTAVVTLYSARDNAFLPRDVRLVTRLAQSAGIAVRNAVLFEDTKRHAYSDSLTGLPNLRYFKTFAEQELRRAERLSYPVTLVMMDLDRFKEINDQYGHSSGDQVLVHMAQLLRGEMRRSDTCIRYGGDEFIGIMPGANRAAAQTIVDKIQEAAAAKPIQLERGDWVRIGVSIGVATFPEDSRSLDLLLKLADKRMYRDKLSRTSMRLDNEPPKVVQA